MESPTELTAKLACGDSVQSGYHTEVKCSHNRSTFYSNIRVCLRGNITSTYFNTAPPSFQALLLLNNVCRSGRISAVILLHYNMSGGGVETRSGISGSGTAHWVRLVPEWW
jgi:hypothetical protein